MHHRISLLVRLAMLGFGGPLELSIRFVKWMTEREYFSTSANAPIHLCTQRSTTLAVY